MNYTDLPVLYRGYLLVGSTLVTILYIYILIRLIGQGRRKFDYILPSVLLAVSLVLFEIMTMIQQGDQSFPVPVALIIPALIILLIWAAILLNMIIRWQKEHISAMSVKEAFDKLPAGLVFYTRSGIPVMVNETMQDISRELFNRPVTDAVKFWDDLKNYRSEYVPEEDQAIVKDRHDRVYSIKKKQMMINDLEVMELTAVDISREYELTRELEVRQDQARVLNARLKALMGTIEYVTMNRELLKLKQALHDNIGQSMLIARRYLYAPDSVERDQMISLWQGNILHLINDEPEEWELPYYVISREAEMLGIRLDITGELPTESRLIPVVDAAISTQLGNTLKHADGRNVFITVSNKKDGYTLSFTNDGKAPEGEIEEKGGLAGLRKEVEGVGGTMEMCSKPRFELTIRLPREEINGV